jgi:urea transporter
MSSTNSSWERSADNYPLVQFVDASLRGAGQVMFQNNPVTGLLILIAVFWGAIEADTWAVGVGALVGLLVGTAAALLLRVDTKSYRQGLFGFSPLLTGAAVPTFLPNTAWTWVLLVFGAAVTTVVTLALSNILKTWGVPALTFPFVLTSWFLMLAAYQFYRIGTGTLSTPALPTAVDSTTADATIGAEFLATSMLNGISQVFLIGYWVSGLIIVVALAVNSRWAALFAVVGTVVSTLLALALGASSASIGEGLFGFSAVLTAIALGCVFFRPSIAVAVYALVGTVFTLIVQAALDTALAPIGIPSFTAPFVFATWLFLFPKRDFAPTPHHEHIEDGVLTTDKANR